MPRKGAVPKRDVLPDPVYNSKLVTRFINKIMLDGKKGVAENIVYDAFETIRAKTGKDPMEVFEVALKFVPVVLVALTIRCLLKCGLTANCHWAFAGWLAIRANVVKKPCTSVWLRN